MDFPRYGGHSSLEYAVGVVEKETGLIHRETAVA